jgi:hypothetical protein
MAYQWVRAPRFRPFALQLHDRITRERLAKELESPETWVAALKKAKMDPSAPGAEYERMKKFFESGEWNITAETDWYMRRAFRDAPGVFKRLRERYWGMSFSDGGRLVASDNPVVIDGDKGQMVGFRNAEVIMYPLSRHALLTGTLEKKRPVQNFKFFCSINTMMLLTADAQIYSHEPDFSWLDENRKHQTDWRLFSKDRF